MSNTFPNISTFLLHIQMPWFWVSLQRAVCWEESLLPWPVPFTFARGISFLNPLRKLVNQNHTQVNHFLMSLTEITQIKHKIILNISIDLQLNQNYINGFQFSGKVEIHIWLFSSYLILQKRLGSLCESRTKQGTERDKPRVRAADCHCWVCHYQWWHQWTICGAGRSQLCRGQKCYF